jgi:hypothetical protein
VWFYTIYINDSVCRCVFLALQHDSSESFPGHAYKLETTRWDMVLDVFVIGISLFTGIFCLCITAWVCVYCFGSDNTTEADRAFGNLLRLPSSPITIHGEAAAAA